MAFLLPFFLAGLAALAVPVAIHLIQREKKQIIAFPSLMFVRRVPYESVRRRKIRHWALLAMRLAGAGAHRGGLRAAVPARRRRRRHGRRRARGRRAGRPLLQHGLRRSLDARAGRGAARCSTRLGPATAPASCSSAPARRWRCSRSTTAPGSPPRWPPPRPAPRPRGYAPALKVAGDDRGRVDAAAQGGRAHQRLPEERLGAERRRSAAGRHDLHAGADHRRRDAQPVGHAGGDAPRAASRIRSGSRSPPA